MPVGAVGTGSFCKTVWLSASLRMMSVCFRLLLSIHRRFFFGFLVWSYRESCTFVCVEYFEGTASLGNGSR